MSEKKTIVWLLPEIDTIPIGGYKVVYEYANRFAADGYDVFIVYPLCMQLAKKKLNVDLYAILMQIKIAIVHCCRRILKRYSFPKWFALDRRVKCEHAFRFCNSKTLKIHGAKFVATAIETSFELAGIRQIETKDKFYFIQDFESWNGNTTEDVYVSYRFPLKKIVISAWLQEEVQKVGEDCVLIPNGFDFDYFKLSNSIEKRSPYEIAMLYHKADRKRCVDSINALKIVKQKIPQLHVTMFGTPDKPDLPEWFSYYQSPDKETHNKIYNTASVFVAASESEGFGLTVGEAMICGCAVACTDNGGFSMMVSNDRTGLLSPVYDCQRLAENIIKLIENNDLRIELAKSGNEFIQQFTWERTYEKFRKEIEG